ncbi:MAG: hypothetical protein Kow00124_12520 [Anaerolineae bacterium]
MTTTYQPEVSVKAETDLLAGLIKAQPAFTAFMKAYQALDADQEAQRLIQEGQSLNSRMMFDDAEAARARFHEVLEQFNQLDSVKAYRQAELALRELMCLVDAVISESAGIDFAVNAQRRSCCGG